MKKAKRLLAVLLTAVMLMTSACLPSYAYIAENNDWHTPSFNNVGGYYLSYGQAAGYILDLLDELLAGLNIFISCDDLNALVTNTVNIFTSNLLLNMDDYLEDAGVMDDSGEGAIKLTSVDNTIRSLYGLGDWIENANLVGLADAVGLLGELTDKDKGLGRLYGVVSMNYLRENGQDDMLVLEHLITIISVAIGPMLRDILGGEMDAGSILEDMLNDLLKDFLGPNASLSNIGGAVKDLLYSMLINDQTDVMNGADTNGDGIGDDWDDPNTAEIEKMTTIDEMVQQLIDWALITGTDETVQGGGFSMLGANTEGLLPDLANQPGGADIGATAIQSDRDLDGALENNTMNLYQLVNNVLEALLGGMLTPMLTDLIIDLVGIDITEEFPNGDPEIQTDMMYGMLLGSVTRDGETGELSSTAGAIENLLVSNGAPELEIANYDSTESPVDTPVGHVTAVIKWFLEDGGLDSLIKIDYQGIHIQDNFMSLLNDVARLAINLLPGLGLFDGGDLSYTADQLNEFYGYDADMNIVNGADETVVDALYLTYDYEEIVYVDSYIENADGSRTPDIYCYLSNGGVVNTTNPEASDYRNPGFIRQYYVVSTDQVYACLIKMLLDSMIDGCYFPEWADTIPSVLAYGLASLASPLLPENNYFARLDAYHTEQNKGSDQFDSNGVNVTPIPYTVEKEITINDPAGSYTKTVTVPQAALDIGCSYLAAYLNAILDLNDQEKLDTDTSLEKFAGEFLVWGFTNYLPMFTGQFSGNALVPYQYSGEEADFDSGLSYNKLEEGVFMSEVNTYLAATFTNYPERTPISDDDNDASFDAIYTLLDDTLFKLIPTSWLPDIHGSQQFVLDWLLGNLIEFDLQGILNLLTVNMDSSGELNLPVIQVLIRVIDRVLALVCNDHALLLDVNRTNVCTADTYVAPSITTLDGLLDCSSSNAALPQLLYQLLVRINEFKRPLLATLLPLIFSSAYERPYDEAYLGRKGISYYKVADLENYVKTFTDHINATFLKSLSNEEDAEAAVDGNAVSIRNDNGTYSIKLSNEYIFGTYPDSASAARDLEYLSDAYYVAVESETEVDEEGNPVIASYDVYRRENYMTTAMNKNTMTDTTVPYGQTYYEYTDFAYASFSPRGANQDIVSYGYEYQTFAPEDFSGKEYFYTNADKALEDASAYVDTYRSFATNDLPNAYGEWLMFSIETQLRANDIWDGNNDGFSVMDTADAEYKTQETTDSSGNAVTEVLVDVDGEPSMPSAMYPFSTSSTSTFSFYDDKTGATITSESMNMFNATNYEQIALALEYGNNPKNNVALDEHDTESVVRLALFSTLGKDALNFDITLNADNEYDGTYQWENLGETNLGNLTAWLTANGFTYEEILDEEGNATGRYTILRPAFRLVDSSFSITTPGIGLVSTPALPTDATYLDIKARRTLQDKTASEEALVALHDAYVDYITALYQNRRSLYNVMDELSYRYEEAEKVRSLPMQNAGDIIILDWALAYAKKHYLFNKGRNYRTTDEIVNGEAVVSKVYTSTSFAVLQEAYDFAFSLREKVVSNAAASNEITQSMVTAAYQGLIYAIRQLVEFTGFADWTQLDYYMAMAKEILEDPNKDHPTLGYASGLDALEDIYSDAETLRADSTIDCESQGLVDTQAAALNTAIQNLVFNTIPSVLPTDSTGSIDTIAVSNVNNRLVGHVFGLEEGTGITADMIGDDGVLTIAGMTINPENGSDVAISPSGRGNGTGSYITGRVRTLERFRYFAVVYGDLNGDTRIDGSDASYVQYYIANGMNTEADMGSVMFVAADANHDNVVDSSDVKYIQNHYTFKKVDANGDGVIDEKDTITQDEHRTESVS